MGTPCQWHGRILHYHGKHLRLTLRRPSTVYHFLAHQCGPGASISRGGKRTTTSLEASTARAAADRSDRGRVQEDLRGPDETALQKWLDTTFIVSDDTEGETIARESRPIQQATLYYLPKTSELVIRAHRSLVDGVGMQLLWHT